MEDNENVVTEVTENVEGPSTEEMVEESKDLKEKIYTEDDFNNEVNKRINEILPRKLERQKSKLERSYAEKEAKYQRLENVLKAGTKKETIDELTDTFTKYYTENGVEIPEFKINRSSKEENILAKAEAAEIIDSGFDEVEEELNRLVSIGAEKMTAREKIVFQELDKALKNNKRNTELMKIGVSKNEIESDEYKTFIKEYGLEDAPISKSYELFKKTKPQEVIEQAGDLTNNGKQVKTFISEAEYDKMTDAEIEKNLYLIHKSMKMW